MPEIKARLQTASKECLEAYEAWASHKKDAKMQEALHDAIHELRKISSRLEIELAISERDQLASKPIPVPSHKSNQKESSVPILDPDDDDDNNNTGNGDSRGQKQVRRKRMQRK
ncbi:MAG: hypothetical protein GC137_00375 [Alphaproteobacteria bacterium]|nr:hypothetical protein [Alphaproteobacteria bacterium]